MNNYLSILDKEPEEGVPVFIVKGSGLKIATMKKLYPMNVPFPAFNCWTSVYEKLPFKYQFDIYFWKPLSEVETVEESYLLMRFQYYKMKQAIKNALPFWIRRFLK